MSLCTVTELRSVLGIGALYTDAQLQEVCDSADNVLLPMLWTNTYNNVAHSSTTTTGTLYFTFPTYEVFYVGQTVVITGNGSKHNGSKTLTGVGEDSISYTINNGTSSPKHYIQPYGSVNADTYADYTTDASIQLAAQFIAVDIWQARNAAGMGSVGIDGSPMPYRLNTQLLSKVRGLIAHALAPGGLVG